MKHCRSSFGSGILRRKGGEKRRGLVTSTTTYASVVWPAHFDREIAWVMQIDYRRTFSASRAISRCHVRVFAYERRPAAVFPAWRRDNHSRDLTAVAHQDSLDQVYAHERQAARYRASVFSYSPLYLARRSRSAGHSLGKQ